MGVGLAQNVGGASGFDSGLFANGGFEEGHATFGALGFGEGDTGIADGTARAAFTTGDGPVMVMNFTNTSSRGKQFTVSVPAAGTYDYGVDWHNAGIAGRGLFLQIQGAILTNVSVQASDAGVNNLSGSFVASGAGDVTVKLFTRDNNTYDLQVDNLFIRAQ